MLYRPQQDYRDLQLLTSWQDQLYAAVYFSVINSVEKVGFAYGHWAILSLGLPQAHHPVMSCHACNHGGM